VSPVIVTGATEFEVAVPLPELPGVMVYVEIPAPPLLLGAANVTTTWASPAATLVIDGAPDTVGSEHVAEDKKQSWPAVHVAVPHWQPTALLPVISEPSVTSQVGQVQDELAAVHNCPVPHVSVPQVQPATEEAAPPTTLAHAGHVHRLLADVQVCVFSQCADPQAQGAVIPDNAVEPSVLEHCAGDVHAPAFAVTVHICCASQVAEDVDP